MNDNRFELLLFWPPLTHISLLLPGFCSSLWCEFLFVYKLYGPLAFSIHFHSLNLKLLVKLILSRHAKKREAKPPLRIIRIVTQSWGEFSTAGDENSVKKYRPKFSPDNFSCIDQSTYTTYILALLVSNNLDLEIHVVWPWISLREEEQQLSWRAESPVFKFSSNELCGNFYMKHPPSEPMASYCRTHKNGATVMNDNGYCETFFVLCELYVY